MRPVSKHAHSIKWPGIKLPTCDLSTYSCALRRHAANSSSMPVAAMACQSTAQRSAAQNEQHGRAGSVWHGTAHAAQRGCRCLALLLVLQKQHGGQPPAAHCTRGRRQTGMTGMTSTAHYPTTPPHTQKRQETRCAAKVVSQHCEPFKLPKWKNKEKEHHPPARQRWCPSTAIRCSPASSSRPPPPTGNRTACGGRVETFRVRVVGLQG